MDIKGWEERYCGALRAEPPEHLEPTRLVVQTAARLPKGKALDLACGTGRNALWLAAQGWDVLAIDGAAPAIERLRERARQAGLPVSAQVADLQDPSFLTSAPALAEAQWDLVTICYYLQRNLLAPAQAAVRPGGHLLVIVHTTEGDEEPTASRLRPGELEHFFSGWEILHRYQGMPDDAAHRRPVSEIVARRPYADLAK